MYNFLNKNGQLAAIGVGILGVLIFFVSAYTSLSSQGYDFSTDLVEVGKKTHYESIGAFNAGLYFTIALIIIAVALLFIFGIVNLMKFPKAATQTVIGILGLCVLYFIFRTMSHHETIGKLGTVLQKFDISESLSKSISGGLWLTILLAAIAGLSMLVFEVRNMFK